VQTSRERGSSANGIAKGSAGYAQIIDERSSEGWRGARRMRRTNKPNDRPLIRRCDLRRPNVRMQQQQDCVRRRGELAGCNAWAALMVERLSFSRNLPDRLPVRVDLHQHRSGDRADDYGSTLTRCRCEYRYRSARDERLGQDSDEG
jgi:hypothetical protein